MTTDTYDFEADDKYAEEMESYAHEYKDNGYILRSRKSWLIDKINKLNKRAKKLGCELIELTFTGNIKKEKHGENENMVVVTEEVFIKGEYPHIDGWELIGVRETTNKKGLIFTRTTPNKEMPKEYHDKTTVDCDHCKTARRRKKSTVLHKDGVYIEVGSTCVKDYFTADPKKFLWLATIDFRAILTEGMFEPTGEKPRYEYDLEKFLGMSSACIDEFGWVSVTKARMDNYTTPTVHYVTFHLVDRDLKEHERVKPTVAHEAEAKAVIAYFKEIDPEENDYLINCKKIADYGYVPERMDGTAASMIFSYRRSLEREIERAERKASKWMGEVKERITVDSAIVKHVNVYDGDWGLTFIYNFNADGNFITWFSTRDKDLHVGDRVKIVGTVKKHDEYRDNEITVLTRCKVELIDEED